MDKVYIPTNKGIKEVMVQNIIRVEASSNYCKIYFANEYPLTVAKVLQWFEDTLPEDFFCRIHRTHLVNRGFISSVSGDFKLTLCNGEQFKVSRRKKRA
ncbi:MAG: LytTR family transcriptional regulator, partial [Chitinophagaceae bacterium]|nr:LytTR family transcriptional regulator [Chitinophagaceae bacterium]